MSDADWEVSEVGDSHGGAGGGGGGEDDDDDYRESGTSGTQGKKQREYDGFRIRRKKFTKAKQVFRFTKSRKQIKLSSTSNGDRGSGCGCFCFSRQRRTLESTNTTGDPNDPNFTYDMLKTLIEKNDFYSKECNTHLP